MEKTQKKKKWLWGGVRGVGDGGEITLVLSYASDRLVAPYCNFWVSVYSRDSMICKISNLKDVWRFGVREWSGEV